MAIVMNMTWAGVTPDVWDSADKFETFVSSRLMPGVAAVGIEGEPVVEIHPAHRVFDATTGEASS